MEKITAVNGQVIKWARNLNNMSISYVASRVGKSAQDIISWEEGTDYPTYAQLEKLSDLYKKPLAVFFFPDVPHISSPKSSCRSLPESICDSLSYKVIRIMNEARARQISLYELNEGINPAPVLLTDIKYPNDIQSAARELRNILGISLEEQKQIRDANEALEMWRDRFLEFGIYVFKEAFSDNSISGFCLYDNEFPVIYINNTMSFTRQIFTLFHEFYHLISNTSGIDKIQDDFFDQLSKSQLITEKSCNQFAAEFLVPNDDFNEEIKGRTVDDLLIENLSQKYNVSREVISRKLLDLRMISQEEYECKREEYLNDFLRAKKLKNGGGNYYNTKVSYLGYGYLNLVFSNYEKRKIDVFQLAEYTGTKIEHLPKLEVSWGWRVKR